MSPHNRVWAHFDSPYLKANIYIRNFHACIADFGISTITRIEPWASAITGETASLVSFTSGGSLPWMSPELLDPGKFNSDPRPTKESDCFALGMVIYEVCSCELLHLHLRFSYTLIGAVRARTVWWLGSGEDQQRDTERNSATQTKGGGAPRIC